VLAPLLALLVGGAGVSATVPWAARAQTEATSCQDVKAQQDLSVRVCTPPDASSSTAAFPVKVTVTNDAGRPPCGQPHYNVTGIAAEVTQTDDAQRLPDPASATWPGPAAETGTLSWTPTFETNGRYDLRVVATGDRPTSGQRAEVTVPITLVVPPHPPTDVATSVAGGKVTVSWAIDDQELDLLSYEVSRAKQDTTEYTRIEFVAATTAKVVDTPPAGQWKYRVTAVRRGATPTEGIASTPSPVATAEVSPAAAENGTGGSTSGSGTGTGTGTGTGSGTGGTTGSGGTGSGTTSSTVARPSISNAPRSTIDLTVLGSARRTTPTTRRPAEPDPGFKEVLPFDTDDAAEAEEEPLELGADEPEAALGERLASDTGERRRSLGFVAGGLLLFVLGMTGLFLKSEVKRADELDPLDPDTPLEPNLPTPAPVVLAEPAPEAVEDAAEPAPLPTRRRRPLPSLPRAPQVEEVAIAPAAAWAAASAEAADGGGTMPEDAANAAAVVAATDRRRGRLGRRRTTPVGDEPTTPTDAPALPEDAAVPAAWSDTDESLVAAPSAPEADVSTAPPAMPAPAAAMSRLTRARQARAERAAEIAELFAGEDATTPDDDAQHLAALAAARVQDRPAVPTGTHRQVRRMVPAVDDPALDVPDPTDTPLRAPARAATTRRAPAARKAAPPTKKAVPATAKKPATKRAAATKASTPATRTTAKTAKKTTNTTTTTRTTPHARRAPTRVPSRPADDRRQGGAAVRPGGRGTGQGNRRVPVR
jgi:hypothetical protein